MDKSLNDIVLTGAMLEMLYGSALVETDETLPHRKSPLSFLGTNNRHITVLVNNPAAAFPPDEELSFLSRMLQACKLDTGDVAILNVANGATIESVFSELTPQTVISFGVELPEAHTELLTIGRLNAAVYLAAPALSQLVAETEDARLLKSRLWSALKSLFGI
jgi:hypothetical protein